MDIKMTPSSPVDRLPPHNIQMEMGVLGCIMLSPNECLGECVEKLKDEGKEAFYDLRHQMIYEMLEKMFNDRHPIDLITVQQKLKDQQLLEQVGGISYLSQIQDGVPSAANLSWYLEQLIAKFRRRKYIRICTELTKLAYEHSGDESEISDRAEREILAVRKIRGDGGIKPIRTLVHESLNEIERAFERKGAISGISTGFPMLDKEIDGMHPADYILIAAFPSVGKTSLAMNIAEHVAIELGKSVGIFSAEMSARSLVTRALCSRARVNLRDVRDGIVTEGDFPKLMSSAGKLAESKIHIDDTSDLASTQLRAKARRMVQQFGVELFIADYAQLFASPGAENRTNEIDQVSKTFKNMGKELGVPVILLSQLTEDAKGGVHLKGARALGEDADLYLMLKRPKNAVDNPAEDIEPIELWIKKQRNGARNVCINLNFLKTYTRFEQAYASINNEDVPNQR